MRKVSNYSKLWEIYVDIHNNSNNLRRDSNFPTDNRVEKSQKSRKKVEKVEKFLNLRYQESTNKTPIQSWNHFVILFLTSNTQC